MWKKNQEIGIEEATMDIYDAKQRVKMLENDEITAAESAFMDGREYALKKKILDLWLNKKGR